MIVSCLQISSDTVTNIDLVKEGHKSTVSQQRNLGMNTKQTKEFYFFASNGEWFEDNERWLTAGLNNCHWKNHCVLAGVDCNSKGYVVRLNLNTNQLRGPIPDSICNLKKLERLYLDFNNLTGSIPESIGNLEKVESILLGRNSFTDPPDFELIERFLRQRWENLYFLVQKNFSVYFARTISWRQR